jgi:MOSC domain-containing protein YiiM
VPTLSRDELEAGLDHVGDAPGDGGRLELVVRRPAIEERELLEAGELDLQLGLLGDNWPDKGGEPGDPEAQITVMNARAAALFADSPEHADWAWAGDQLYVDLDLGKENLPPGSRIAVGEAVLEVTAEPHLGCGKFSRRFGVDALKVVNSPVGREMRLRGLNAKVIQPGEVAVGDEVHKLT